MISYFQKNKKRKSILNKIKEKRIIINDFYVPLGIVPIESSKPKEGVSIELKTSEDSADMYSYSISISANRLSDLFLKLIKLFPYYATMVIERKSEDINREFDVLMSDPDISLSEIRRVFKKYNELWVECGFVGFGVIDEYNDFEIFINLDKEIIINTPFKNIKKINRILDSFNLLDETPVFISSDIHWHYSLSSIVSYESYSETYEYIFDYYDIINNLKHSFGFAIINDDEKIINKEPKWWNVTVRCLGKCKTVSFVSTYYIVANTIEEMETVIEEKMKELDIEYYYIYDYYNVDPNNYHHKSVNLSNKDNLFFRKAPFGIWAESDIFISKVKDISLFYINRSYERAY